MDTIVRSADGTPLAAAATAATPAPATLAQAIPNAPPQALDGQVHNVHAAAVAPARTAFLPA